MKIAQGTVLLETFVTLLEKVCAASHPDILLIATDDSLLNPAELQRLKKAHGL